MSFWVQVAVVLWTLAAIGLVVGVITGLSKKKPN